MPKFAANLSMLFNEVGFLERFDAAEVHRRLDPGIVSADVGQRQGHRIRHPVSGGFERCCQAVLGEDLGEHALCKKP